MLAAVFGCLMMGLYANRPFAIAPYMGENAFIAYTVVQVLGYHDRSLGHWLGDGAGTPFSAQRRSQALGPKPWAAVASDGARLCACARASAGANAIAIAASAPAMMTALRGAARNGRRLSHG